MMQTLICIPFIHDDMFKESYSSLENVDSFYT